MTKEASSESSEDQPVDPALKEVIVPPRRAAARTRWAEATFLMGLCMYAFLAALAHRYAYFGWDLSLAHGIQSISLPGFAEMMIGVSMLGNGWLPWVLVVISGLGLLRAGLRVEGVICLAGAGSGWLLNQLFKSLIGRPRPSEALVNVAGVFHFESFPSGHVVFFVEFFGFLLFLAFVLLTPGPLRRALLVALALLIALVGVSRIYLGAHWPSDVVGAYLAGGVWLMIMIEVYRRSKAKYSRQK